MDVIDFVSLARKAVRFDTPRGFIDFEQLWDLPLRNKTGVDLNSVAVAAHKALKDAEDATDFVGGATNPKKDVAALRMKSIKFVIDAKLQEGKAEVARQQASNQREVILAALERKQNAAIDNMTEEELKASLKSLEPA